MKLPSTLLMNLSLALIVGCDSPERGSERATGSPVVVEKTKPSPPVPVTSSSKKGVTRPTLAPRNSEQKYRPLFTDVASQVGIDFTYFNDEVPDRFFLAEATGGGAGWSDLDLDGDLDVYYTNGCDVTFADRQQTVHQNQLFMNVGAEFVNVTAESNAGHNGFGQGCAIADYDADGFPDIFVANFGDDVLYRNNGDGTFSDVTDEGGVGDPLWGTGCVWFDADADGLLDLYVATYGDLSLQNHKVCVDQGIRIYCGPFDFPAVVDRMFINQGDGTFVERLQELGMAGGNGHGLGVIAVDLDDDLRPELYVANDLTANFLFTRSDNPHIRGRGQSDRLYSEIAGESGCAVSGDGAPEASMGIACADFDGDRKPDIYLTHFVHAKNTLYHNLGKLLFLDDSVRTGVAAISREVLGFGTIAFDFDADGWDDLMVTNGHVLGPNFPLFEMKPQLLRNDGSGRFVEVSDQAGEYFKQKRLGRGMASADFDNDGDIDVTVTHLRSPTVLLRNDTPVKSDWIGLDLRSQNRIPPVGGRIVLRQGERTIVRPIFSGGSYLSSSDPRQQFWVADGDFQIEVHWPSGVVDQLQNWERNRYYRIAEGCTANGQLQNVSVQNGAVQNGAVMK